MFVQHRWPQEICMQCAVRYLYKRRLTLLIRCRHCNSNVDECLYTAVLQSAVARLPSGCYASLSCKHHNAKTTMQNSSVTAPPVVHHHTSKEALLPARGRALLPAPQVPTATASTTSSGSPQTHAPHTSICSQASTIHVKDMRLCPTPGVAIVRHAVCDTDRL